MVQNSTISIKVKPHTKHYERTKGQKQIHMILKKRFKGGTRIELVKQEMVERLIKAKWAEGKNKHEKQDVTDV